MIERQFIAQKIKEHEIQKYIAGQLSGVGLSHIRIQRTPLGEKIVIYSSRPGLIIGKKGANIKKLTQTLKKKFGLENPTIETAEVEQKYLDPQIVAEEIALSLEKFGTNRFKGIGHKMTENILRAGGLGAEISISGKVPSSRAKSWRFYAGYLKKCGDMAIEGVKKGYTQALLKSGTIGIKVSIMPPDLVLSDEIKIFTPAEQEASAKKAADAAVVKKAADDKKDAEAAEKKKSRSKKPESKESKASPDGEEKPKRKAAAPKKKKDDAKADAKATEEGAA